MTTALILTFSPEEKEQQAYVFYFSDACPANPVAYIFKKAECDSPSPWRRGPG
jgi:hypothetical protein